MQIAVCLKRVPDTATKIRVDSDGKSIESAGVQFVISPYDEYAIEEGIAIKEHAGDGEVVVFCLGPEAAQQNLRHALAMGADRAVLLRHEGAELDGFQIARVLATALADGGFDMVLFGRLAADTQAGQVGPMTARLLGMPCVTDVVKLEVADGNARVEREVEGLRRIIRAQLPAVMTTQKGLNEPRYASLKGIMAAKKKPLETVEPQIPDATATVEALTLPPPRPPGRIIGEGVEAVPELVRVLREEAKVI